MADTVPPNTAIPVREPVAHPVRTGPENVTVVEENVYGGGLGGHRARSVSWGAIIAGSVIGVGVMILLSLLGIGIGLAAADPIEPGSNIASVGIGAAIWFIVSQLVALFVGGYAASRLSANLGKQKAWLHGATVWGLATIALVYMAVSGAGAVINTGFSALQAAGSTVASAAQAVIPDDVNLSSLGNLSETAIENLPQPVRNALDQQNLSSEQIKRRARSAFNAVVSERERAQVQSTVGDVAQDVISSPSDALTDIEDGIDRLVGQGGTFSEEDRREFLTEVEQRFGIQPQEAEEFVVNVETQAKEAAAQAEQALQDARQQAAEAAQAATEGVSTAAFWASIASLLGLGAAVFGAAAGRRDEPVEEDYDDVRST